MCAPSFGHMLLKADFEGLNDIGQKLAKSEPIAETLQSTILKYANPRHLDVFKMDALFFAFEWETHWSLAIVCNPGIARRSALRDEGQEGDVSDEERQPYSCILHMDSLKLHADLKVAALLRQVRTRYSDLCVPELQSVHSTLASCMRQRSSGAYMNKKMILAISQMILAISQMILAISQMSQR